MTDGGAGRLALVPELDISEFDAALSSSALLQGWTIGNAVNGGVQMALLAARLREVVDEGHRDAVALSAYFLTAAGPGSYEVGTELVRTGRTMSTAQASLWQDQDGERIERLRMLATFGDLDVMSAPLRRQAQPPPMPAPQDCVGLADVPAGQGLDTVPPILHRMDIRFDPDTAMWALGKPSRAGRMRAWIRFADGREPDALSLIYFLDAMPPVAFDLGLMGWAPTLEFSAHVRARPAPGWLQVELRTDNFSAGLLEEDARIWDSAGRLVAQSRQLAAVRVPEGV